MPRLNSHLPLRRLRLSLTDKIRSAFRRENIRSHHRRASSSETHPRRLAPKRSDIAPHPRVLAGRVDFRRSRAKRAINSSALSPSSSSRAVAIPSRTLLSNPHKARRAAKALVFEHRRVELALFSGKVRPVKAARFVVNFKPFVLIIFLAALLPLRLARARRRFR